jgi:subtilase family serine protease
MTGAALAAGAVPSRVLQPVDSQNTIELSGNTLPMANPDTDQGVVEPDLSLGVMRIVLKRSPEQDQALAAFNERQNDVSSPDYHHWLHAEEFGDTYGPSDADILAVTRWLESAGLRVQGVSKGKVSIDFTGSAAQVESAFQVQLHRYLIGGAPHVANDRDPRIPRALAPVVQGVGPLNDFRPVSAMLQGGYVQRDPVTGILKPYSAAPAAALGASGGAQPDLVSSGSSGPIEDLTPYDFATIYNVLPLWTASKPINGSGITVAIAGQSDVDTTDIKDYRSIFGLPAAPAFNTVHNGADPGLVSGDQGEQTLDLEMVSAAAPGAALTLVVTASKNGGAFSSAQYIIDHETAPILSISYQQCELLDGQAGNAQIKALWQQGATEGISIFVASGDFGSAQCTPGNQSRPTEDKDGVQVNALASTPYATAVGGTDFVWNFLKGGEAEFWTTNDSKGASAKGYVPEMVWNSSCANPLLQEYGFVASGPIYGSSQALCTGILTKPYLGLDFADLVNPSASGGGVSHCTVSTADKSSSCSGGYPKPSWQNGTGVPADGLRDVPDLALFSANWVYGPANWGGSAILICQSSNSPTGTCKYSPSGIVYQQDGGTSAASPYMAGIMALVLQKAGARQGLANPALYKLAATDSLTECNAGTMTKSGLTVGDGPTCVFHDVTIGTNAAPCVTSTVTPNPSCSTGGEAIGVLDGYATTAGYDRATGLGSINASNLVNDWSKVAPTASLTLSAESLTFSSTKVGSTSAAQTVTVKNTGKVAATIYTGAITVSGSDASSFEESTTCGASLAIGASCTLTVKFKPAAAGSLTATLSIADNAAIALQQVSLKGTAVAVAQSASARSLRLPLGGAAPR